MLVVTNERVAPLYLDKTVHALTIGNPNVTVESVILPDGEKYKDMVCFFILLSFWRSPYSLLRLERHFFLVGYSHESLRQGH